jgi:hypothetical protein
MHGVKFRRVFRLGRLPLNCRGADDPARPVLLRCVYAGLRHIMMLNYSTTGPTMAFVNFSVPDEVKAAFDRAFQGRNKSAVIAELMKKAVAEREREERRLALFETLTARRALRPAVKTRRLREARIRGRP